MSRVFELAAAPAGHGEGWGKIGAMKTARFALAALFLLLALPAFAHDIKDPVCRMTVDTDTTPYQRTVDGKTYYFCSTKCESQFDKSPKTFIDLLAKLSADGGAGYTVALQKTHAEPNVPTLMAFTVTNNKTHKLVTDYQLTHEKLLHFIMVSRDMQWFEHQHPVLGSDGVFRITWTFPKAGRYYLYADFTPVDGDNQIKQMTLDVGDTAPSTAPVVLYPEKPHAKLVGDTKIAVSTATAKFTVGTQNILTYRFTDMDGKPCADMQPFIGAMGHMIAIKEDGTHMVHVHVLHGVAPGSYAATMLQVMQAADTLKVTADQVTEHGPQFSFKLTLSTPGVYRIWAQFMRHNNVLTVPLTVRATVGL